ncbi:MAG TPA: DUF4157 domain-containing protein, partial [Kofleriaceae bacterium]
VATDDPDVEAALARAGSGAPLSAGVRRKMEDELGVSLERVRVHTDPVAARAAQALRAEAFTVGEDIFFAANAYAPESRGGQKLLAHELTHVVQGWQGRGDAGTGGLRVSQPGESLEQEADAVADRVDRGRGEAEQAGSRGRKKRKRGDGDVKPASEASAKASPRTVHRKATEQRPTAQSTRQGTIHPTIRTSTRRIPSPHKPIDTRAAFAGQLDSAHKTIKAGFHPLKAGVKDAKKATIGVHADAHHHQDKQKTDAQKRKHQADEKQHHAKGKAAKDAKHDELSDVPPPPKLDPHSPIQFKKITDFSKFLPPPMPDQDARERKHLLALVRNKIIGEQAAAQKTLGKLHAAQVKQAAAIRAMKPGLQATIASAQKAALGQVNAAETSQAAAVAGAYNAAKGRVNAAATAAKGKVESAYTDAVAAINRANQDTAKRIADGQQKATKDITDGETNQIIAVQAAYSAVKGTVASNASDEASHASGMADSVALPFDGDKLDAAKKAARGVADGWAKDIPGKMQEDAEKNIYSHQGETEQGVHSYADQQRGQVTELNGNLKDALDGAHTQSLDSAAKARSQALSQIDSIAASTCASLSAQSAAQVAAVHQQAAAARQGIIKAGQSAQTQIVAACDKAAAGLDKGAAGLVAGAKEVEAPSPEYTHTAVAQAQALLKQGSASINQGLNKTAGQSAQGLTAQAAAAAKGMADLAESAKKGA